MLVDEINIILKIQRKVQGELMKYVWMGGWQGRNDEIKHK